MAIEKLQQVCHEVRVDILNMVTAAKSGHVGGSLSCVEILTSLYFDVMKTGPELNALERDKLVLCKGHAAPVLYAVLAHRGFFPREELMTLRKLGSRLQGHPDMKKTPGVDASTGSLGQGCSIAIGMALAARLRNNGQQVYAIVGDGEMQEGQFWEAMMAAAHYKLENLTVIIDHNGLQIDGTNDEVMSLGDVAAKMKAFGLEVLDVDGHNLSQLKSVFAVKTSKPKCVLAKTVKGKGVSFMENQVGWHGKAPSEAELMQSLKEFDTQLEVQP